MHNVVNIGALMPGYDLEEGIGSINDWHWPGHLRYKGTVRTARLGTHTKGSWMG
jgi:hypothetical protein